MERAEFLTYSMVILLILSIIYLTLTFDQSDDTLSPTQKIFANDEDVKEDILEDVEDIEDELDNIGEHFG